jgi:hypothetical protein
MEIPEENEQMNTKFKEKNKTNKQKAQRPFYI